MYRVFCESFHNYQSSYKDETKSEYRFKLIEPMELLVDIDRYRQELGLNSMLYRRLSDLIAYMEQNVERYPKLKAFIWTLESRGLKGYQYGVASREELEEQTKIVNMFLNLMYWDYSIH